MAERRGRGTIHYHNLIWPSPCGHGAFHPSEVEAAPTFENTTVDLVERDFDALDDGGDSVDWTTDHHYTAAESWMAAHLTSLGLLGIQDREDGVSSLPYTVSTPRRTSANMPKIEEEKENVSPNVPPLPAPATEVDDDDDASIPPLL